MANSVDPLDQILFLARAESRVEILSSLAQDGEATQRELRTRLEVSRTTASRSLQSLTERGWIETSEGTYRLTRAGKYIATAFDDLLETVEQIDELAEFLRWFPPEVEAPAFLAASDVEVTYSTEAEPYAPARRQSEILHSAQRLRVLLPAIELESTKTLAEQVTDHGLEIESVVSPAVEAAMDSDEFRPPMRAAVRTGRVDLFVAESHLPFYLGLAADGRVQVGLADDDGFPRALLETTDDDIRSWAETVYQQYRKSGRHKPVHEF